MGIPSRESKYIVDQYGRWCQRFDESIGGIKELQELLRQESRESSHVQRAYQINAHAYSAITISAAAYAQIPKRLWRRRGRAVGRGQQTEVMGHPVLDLIEQPVMPREKVHEGMDRYTWDEQWLTYLFEGGNAFAFIDGWRDRERAIPENLLLFGIDRVKPLRKNNRSALMGWQITMPNGDKKDIGFDAILHWKLPNPYDPHIGLAPKLAIALTLAGDRARDVFDEAFFNNSANPSAILTYKGGELDEEQREAIRRAWAEMHEGPSRAGRLAVMTGEWDLKIWGLEHAKLQFSDVKKFARQVVASAFSGFPVEMLNAQETGGISKSDRDAARLTLFENVVIPQCRRFEGVFNNRIVKQLDPSLYLSCDENSVPVILQSYLDAKSTIFDRLAKHGVGANPLFEMLEMPVDPQPGHDTGFIPGNYLPATVVAGIDEVPQAQAASDEPGSHQHPATKPRQIASAPNYGGCYGALKARLQAKVKKTLFSIRRDALRDPSVLRLGPTEKAKAEWQRTCLPPLAVAMQLGREEVRRDYLRGGPSWAELLTPAQLDEQLAAMQSRMGDLSFDSGSVADECVKHLERLMLFFDESGRTAAKLAQENGADSATQYLSRLDTVARMAATAAVDSAYRAGRFLEALQHGLPVQIVVKGGCRVDHRDEYPGAPSVKLEDISGCGCEVEVRAC